MIEDCIHHIDGGPPSWRKPPGWPPGHPPTKLLQCGYAGHLSLGPQTTIVCKIPKLIFPTTGQACQAPPSRLFQLMYFRFCVPSVGCGEASGAASVTLWGSFSALKQPIKLWLRKLSCPIPPCCYEWCFLYLGYQEGVNNYLSSWGGLIF